MFGCNSITTINSSGNNIHTTTQIERTHTTHTNVSSGSHQFNKAERDLNIMLTFSISLLMYTLYNKYFKLIYSNDTNKITRDAKYGKQNNQHKYLLPEIMPESKYGGAMKTTILSRLNRFQTLTREKQKSLANQLQQHAVLLCILCTFFHCSCKCSLGVFS